MANHASALKRVRSTQKKRQANRYQHKSARTAVKKFYQEKEHKVAEGFLKKVTSMVDKLTKKKIIHKKKGDRIKSKLSIHLKKLAQHRSMGTPKKESKA